MAPGRNGGGRSELCHARRGDGSRYLRQQPTAKAAEFLMTAKPPKRPRNFNQAGKLVIDIATGQVEDREPTLEEQGKDPAAAALGRKGGAARAKALGAKRRTEIARKAARKRWER